jgi:REP element-mobilizing transposase RayT
MPYIRIWIHYVWSTKYRLPTLTDNYRFKLFDHIKQNAFNKNIFLDRINGYHEHVHCLISLGSGQTIDKIAQLIKGESAFWFNNKSNFKTEKLEWQDEYFAVSVGEIELNIIKNYIDNQENHHRVKTFAEEYEELLRDYGFENLAKAHLNPNNS